MHVLLKIFLGISGLCNSFNLNKMLNRAFKKEPKSRKIKYNTDDFRKLHQNSFYFCIAVPFTY